MRLALQGIPLTACTEHELVAAVRRGDDRAFEQLFSRYERRVTAYVAGMVGDRARAEDITQDVFISALRRMRETRRPIAFKPWIYEIAKNACIDELRRARRNQEVSLDDSDGSGPAACTVYVHAPPPQAAIESKQRLADLCGAFGGLSESHHRVLVLRELEGLSYNEIGERLGMTRAMVESTLFRARRRLSEEYEELVSGRRCARVQSLIETGGGQMLTSLGTRDRRQLTRHLTHCEPCRRRALISGVDESLLRPRRGIARIAALLPLPLPLPLLRWRRGGSSSEAAAQSGSHTLAVAQSLQNVARLVDPCGPSAAFSRAAAAAAAIVIASASGGFVANLGAPAGQRVPSSVPPAAAASGLPVLSITKILAPVKVSTGTTTAGYPFPVLSSVTGQKAPGQSSVQARGSQSAAGVVGPVPAGSAGAQSAPGSPPGSGVSVPTAVPDTPSDAPSPPSPPGGSPNVGDPQVPTVSTPTVQGVRVPTQSSVQSTVDDTQTTVTQTTGQVEQSASTPPSTTAISPSSSS